MYQTAALTVLLVYFAVMSALSVFNHGDFIPHRRHNCVPILIVTVIEVALILIAIRAT